MHATQSLTDYKQLLSRLCHLVALSETKKVEDVVDSLVVSVIEIDANHPANDSTKIEESLRVYFGVQLEPKDLNTAISRLLHAGALIRQPVSGALGFSPTARAAQMQRVSEASNLEATVKQQWVCSIRDKFPSWDESVEVEMWECLKAYLTRVFRRHGAQTALIASGQQFSDAELDKSIGELLESAINEECKTVDHKMARDAVKSFLREQTPERARYVAQLLDGTFSFYALFTDEITQGYLKKAIPRILVFLDTNFLFGVLNLHNNPQNEVSVELVALVQDQKLPFELYYHEDSLIEMQETIRQVEKGLVRYAWSSSLSRAAINTRSFELSGLDLKFHEANAHQQIEPSAFFMKYHHLDTLLNAKGFKIYRRSDKRDDDKPDERTLELISRYKKFLEERFPSKRQKGFNTLRHDITVWRATKALRKSGTSGLDVGALFLSADQRLFAFDWGTLSNDTGLGVVVLPSQLLQLLRPFVPKTPDFDQKFADIFALPEFRSGGSDFSQVTRRVLGFLATVKDLSEETASAILADELLLSRLKKIETDEEIKAAIESEVLNKNAQLTNEYKDALYKLDAAKSEADRGKEVLTEAEQKLRQKDTAIAQREAELERERQEKTKITEAATLAATDAIRVRHELGSEKQSRMELETTLTSTKGVVSELQAQLNQIESNKNWRKKIWRTVFGILTTLAGWGLIIWMPVIRNWQWLQTNQHKISLYLAALILIAGLSWAVFAWKHRAWALSAIVLAVVIRLIGVL